VCLPHLLQGLESEVDVEIAADEPEGDAVPPGRDVRFHLMGHSFGCIVVSGTVAGPLGRLTGAKRSKKAWQKRISSAQQGKAHD
jgi:hypothetical protein